MSLRSQVQGGECQAGQEDLGGEKLGTRNSDGVVTANKLARMGYKVNVSSVTGAMRETGGVNQNN